MRARVDGAWREVSGGRVRVGGVWRTLSSIRTYVGGAWKDAKSFTLPMTFEVAPDSILRSAEVFTLRTTQAATGTPSGGLAPFTYVWTRVSGDTGIGITSPNAASTTFQRYIEAETTYTAVFQCACTDALGTTLTDTVTVEIIGVSFFPE